MKNFFNIANQVKEFSSNEGFLGFSCDKFNGHKIEVQTTGETFKDLVEGFSRPCNVEESEIDGDYHIRLEVTIENVNFFTVMDDTEYQFDFDSWLHDESYEFTDEEFYNNGVSEQDRVMKDCGHKITDFM